MVKGGQFSASCKNVRLWRLDGGACQNVGGVCLLAASRSPSALATHIYPTICSIDSHKCTRRCSREIRAAAGLRKRAALRAKNVAISLIEEEEKAMICLGYVDREIRQISVMRILCIGVGKARKSLLLDTHEAHVRAPKVDLILPT
ncbi:hypothetical protein SELMODRAFT_431777 [Selaginella moellendorffii]|uniref:Uncharacterized protein n=1 Tax=Selaginella moellendorffii TaxID=88036 RepID=D8TDS0_SELML|nr:hypothetical protein SELMODRAFT_431777 [Selaginella moellendorffii]